MCKYCETYNGHWSKRDKLMSNDNGTYYVIINDCNYLEDSVIGHSVPYSLFGVKINYCPMCGRKLGD